MNFLWMTVVTALRAIRRNVLRSALTMLGVIIGVAAVLTMVSIGRGANAAVQQQIASLGNNLIMVIPGATTANGVHSSSGSAASITVADATAIAKESPAVADVAWAKRDVVQVVYGNQNWATAAHGVPPTYLSVRDWPLSAGRFFDQRDDAGASAVAVLGQTVVDQLFAQGEDPIGVKIRVKNVPFEVIGVLARKGQTAWGQDQDDVVLMPFLTAERRVLGTKILGTVDMIFVDAGPAVPILEPLMMAEHVDGILLVTMAGNGDPQVQSGCAIYVYAANRPMERRAFYDADGELLIVPQQGRLFITTELGRLLVEPLEIAVIPRGIRFKVELPEGAARGYVCENFGAAFRLPDLGPIGSNGLACERDFRTPRAWYEDREDRHEAARYRRCPEVFVPVPRREDPPEAS